MVSNLTASNSTITSAVQQTLEYSQFWPTISIWFWWYMVVSSVLSILFYVYNGLVLFLNGDWRKYRILFSIICADSLILITVCLSTLIQHFLSHHHALVDILCKCSVYISQAAAFYSNWAWLLLWSRRLLAVFYPLQHHFTDSSLSLLLLLVASLLIESPNLVLTTAYTDTGLNVCHTRTDFINWNLLRWLAVAEIGFSYVFPLFLTSIAHTVLLLRPWTRTSVAELRRESLSGVDSRPDRTPDTIRKILPRNYHQRQRKAWRRRVMVAIVASLDLTLNLPVHLVKMMKCFCPLGQLLSNYVLSEIVEMTVYVLYYCQYLLIPVYVRLLVRKRDVKKRAFTASSRLEQPTEL